MASVKVCVRLRPLNRREKASTSNHIPVVTTNTSQSSVTIVKGLGAKSVQHNYAVDQVFGSFSEQEEVFTNAVLPVVTQVLQGYESTVFAYGQTGTGKTYTMEGDVTSEQHMGVIPRSCLEIFSKLAKQDRYVASKVSCSYLEIYNEELSDLLVDETTNKKLRVCTTSKGSGGRVVCMGLSSRTVTSAQEVIDVLNEARERRQIGETKMNKQSSRSHCLFTLQVESTEVVEGGQIERIGKLHLVDLAGSECAKSTGASAGSSRMRESQNINKSLLTLGRVISTLKNGNGRVPYRDSKLTRLLQEALGGRCKTLIIATLSPSILSIEESLSTMSYAEQAHGIQNKPIEARARMQMSMKNSTSSTNHGMSSGSGLDVSTRTFVEMEQKLMYYQSQCSEAQGALAKKHLQVSEMSKRAEEAELLVKTTMSEMTAVQQTLVAAEKNVELLQHKAIDLTLKLKKKEVMIEQRTETERCLTNEAELLLQTLDALSTRNASDYKQLVSFSERDTAIKCMASETSVVIDNTCNTIMDEKEQLSTATVQSTNAIDNQTRETKTSMLELARECGIGTQVHIDAGQSLSNQMNTWMSDDLATLATLQRTMNEAMSKSRTQLKTKTMPYLLNQSKRNIDSWVEKCESSEESLNTFVAESITAMSTKRMENRQEQTQQFIATNTAKHQQHINTSNKLSDSLKQQSKTMKTLLANLKIQESQLNNHTITIDETTSTLMAHCTTTKKNLSSMKTTLQQLNTLAGKTLLKQINKQEKEMTDQLLKKICTAQITKKGLKLNAQQHQTLSSTIEKTMQITSTNHTQMIDELKTLKTQVWGDYTAKQEEEQEQFTSQLETTLSEGRKGNMHESLKISINAGSNDVLNQLTQQRKRLANECTQPLATAIDRHSATSQDISDRTNDHCDQLQSNVSSSLSSARLELATTMDTLDHVAQVHTEQRNEANKQHAFDLNRMISSVKKTTEEQKNTLHLQEMELTTILEEQRNSQRAMVDEVMNAVRTMLEKNVEHMSNDLNAKIATMRTNNEELVRNAGNINGSIDMGETSMLSSISSWHTSGTTTDQTLTSTIKEDLFVLHDQLQSLEDKVQEDVNEMVMHVVERDALNASTVAALTHIEEQVEEEIKTHSTAVSESTITHTTALLEESSEWNDNVIRTHNNIATLGAQNKLMLQHYQQTHSNSDAAIETMNKQIHQWKEDMEQKCIAPMNGSLHTNETMNTTLKDTKEMIQQKVLPQLAENTNAIRALVDQTTTAVSDALSLNTQMKKNSSGNNTTIMKCMKDMQQESTNMVGDNEKTGDGEDGEEKETTVRHMQHVVDALHASNVNNTTVLSSTSSIASATHLLQVKEMKATMEQETDQDALLLSSTAEYLKVKNTTMSNVLTEESMEMTALITTSCNDVLAAVEEQHDAMNTGNNTSNNVRLELEEKTSKAMNETMMTTLNSMTNIMTNFVENVDVCMTSMENQTTATTSQMRVSATEHLSTIITNVEEMKNQHNDVLCAEHIMMHEPSEKIQSQGTYKYSQALTKTPTEEEMIKDVVLNEQDMKTVMKLVNKEEEEEEEGEEEKEVEEGEQVEEEEEEERKDEDQKKNEEKEKQHNQDETKAKNKSLVALEASSKQQRKALVALDKNSTRLSKRNPNAPSSSRQQSRLPVPRRSHTASHKRQ